MLNRLLTLLNRKRQAKGYGIALKRIRNFKMPSGIEINGETYPVSIPDERGARVALIEILFDDCYGLKSLKNSKINFIIDIGAHAGIFCLAARQNFPAAVIHAYEPNPSVLPNLTIQARTANAIVYPQAVGLKEGRISLSLNADSVQTRVFSDPLGSVGQISFQNAVRKIGGSVDLVKMDCEGTEWEIFKDTETWSQVSNLTMEYHLFAGQRHDDAKHEVQRLGFRIRVHRAHSNYGILQAYR